MSTIIIPTFGGEVPRTTPRLLEQAQAVNAVNCDVSRGALEALRSPLIVTQVNDYAGTIFKHEVDGWLVWNGSVAVVKSAVLDADSENPLGHILLCGDKPYPTQYLAGGTICRLGLPRPCAAPDVEIFMQESEEDEAQEEDVAGDSSVERNTSYCYTYIRSLADGTIQQESAPSPPSTVVDVEDGYGVLVSGFVIPEEYDMGVTHIRIYRTVSGVESSDFRFLVELEATVAVYTDILHDKDVPTEILRTSIWDHIPYDAKGLIKTDNGIYAAFRGNELLISEPFFPYAFPEPYRLTVEDSIVALGHVDGTIIVLTTGRPYLATGGIPEGLQLTHLPIEQACVSAASVASLPGGVVYASPDGLMLFTAGEQTLASAQTFTREQWQDMRPETLMGTVHDGRYVGFFAGSNTGFLFSVGAKDVVRVVLHDAWRVHCLYHHSEDDAVYIGVETPDGHGIYRLEGGEPMPYQWRSKPFFTSALASMSALRVEGEYQRGSSVVVRVFGPNQNRARARLRLANARTHRIKPMKSEKLWSVEVCGNMPVYEVRLGSSVEDVEHGQ